MVKVVQTITVTGQIHSCLHYIHIHNKHVFVVTKHVFCHDKLYLPQQNFCRNHIMYILSWQTCVTTKVLLRQTRLSRQNFCCIMHTFVDKRCVLSWQTHVCHDKMFCCNKIMFVTTKLCLLSQKLCHNNHTFVERKKVFCLREHVFVAKKIMLVPVIVPVLTVLSSVSLSSGILPTAFKKTVYQMGIEERRSWG